MTEQSKTLTHVKARDVYVAGEPKTPVSVVRTTEQIEKAYLLNEYREIFPAYDDERHVIEKGRMGNRQYLVLHEKKTVGKNEASELPEPGFLHFDYNIDLGVYLKPVQQREMDDHLNLRSNMAELERNVLGFFQQSEAFDRNGMDTSRGALLYGPPGNGKTHAMLRIANACISNLGAYVFMISDKDVKLSELMDYRGIFADRPTVFLLEEITEKAKRKTEKLLSFLDGEYSWSNNYTLATTNYPGELPGNIVDRPGRFDRLVSVKNPDPEQRSRYLQHQLDDAGLTGRLVEETDGYNLSYLRELAVQINLFDRSVDEVLSRFEEKKRRMREAFRQPDEQLGFVAPVSNNGHDG